MVVAIVVLIVVSQLLDHRACCDTSKLYVGHHNCHFGSQAGSMWCCILCRDSGERLRI